MLRTRFGCAVHRTRFGCVLHRSRLPGLVYLTTHTLPFGSPYYAWFRLLRFGSLHARYAFALRFRTDAVRWFTHFTRVPPRLPGCCHVLPRFTAVAYIRFACGLRALPALPHCPCLLRYALPYVLVYVSLHTGPPRYLLRLPRCHRTCGSVAVTATFGLRFPVALHTLLLFTRCWLVAVGCTPRGSRLRLPAFYTVTARLRYLRFTLRGSACGSAVLYLYHHAQLLPFWLYRLRVYRAFWTTLCCLFTRYTRLHRGCYGSLHTFLPAYYTLYTFVWLPFPLRAFAYTVALPVALVAYTVGSPFVLVTGLRSILRAFCTRSYRFDLRTATYHSSPVRSAVTFTVRWFFRSCYIGYLRSVHIFITTHSLRLPTPTTYGLRGSFRTGLRAAAVGSFAGWLRCGLHTAVARTLHVYGLVTAYRVLRSGYRTYGWYLPVGFYHWVVTHRLDSLVHRLPQLPGYGYGCSPTPALFTRLVPDYLTVYCSYVATTARSAFCHGYPARASYHSGCSSRLRSHTYGLPHTVLPCGLRCCLRLYVYHTRYRFVLVLRLLRIYCRTYMPVTRFPTFTHGYYRMRLYGYAHARSFAVRTRSSHCWFAFTVTRFAQHTHAHVFTCRLPCRLRAQFTPSLPRGSVSSYILRLVGSGYVCPLHLATYLSHLRAVGSVRSAVRTVCCGWLRTVTFAYRSLRFLPFTVPHLDYGSTRHYTLPVGYGYRSAFGYYLRLPVVYIGLRLPHLPRLRCRACLYRLPVTVVAVYTVTRLLRLRSVGSLFCTARAVYTTYVRLVGYAFTPLPPQFSLHCGYRHPHFPCRFVRWFLPDTLQLRLHIHTFVAYNAAHPPAVCHLGSYGWLPLPVTAALPRGSFTTTHGCRFTVRSGYTF